MLGARQGWPHWHNAAIAKAATVVTSSRRLTLTGAPTRSTVPPMPGGLAMYRYGCRCARHRRLNGW